MGDCRLVSDTLVLAMVQAQNHKKKHGFLRVTLCSLPRFAFHRRRRRRGGGEHTSTTSDQFWDGERGGRLSDCFRFLSVSSSPWYVMGHHENNDASAAYNTSSVECLQNVGHFTLPHEPVAR